MGKRYLGRWHLPIPSKPFSAEVVVYERAALSESCPKLGVEVSPWALTGRNERSYVSTEPKAVGAQTVPNS
jgi:hypothetical protein